MQTITLNPTELVARTASTVSFGPAFANVWLSDYDIPHAVDLWLSEGGRDILIEFKYSDKEKSKVPVPGKGLLFKLGGESRKIGAMIVHTQGETVQEIVRRVAESVDAQYLAAKKENQRLNYLLIKELVKEVLPKLLGRELAATEGMKHNGKFHIIANNDGSYLVNWSRSGLDDGAGALHPLVNDDQLKTFLEAYGIPKEEVTRTLETLRQKRNHTIPEVWLTDDQISGMGRP